MNEKVEINLLSKTDAAKKSGVSRATIDIWVKSGLLPEYYSGFRSKYKRNSAGWISPIDLANVMYQRRGEELDGYEDMDFPIVFVPKKSKKRIKKKKMVLSKLKG